MGRPLHIQVFKKYTIFDCYILDSCLKSSDSSSPRTCDHILVLYDPKENVEIGTKEEKEAIN
jgi:hypothetical protein